MASTALDIYSQKTDLMLRFSRVLLGPRDWIQEIPTTLTASGFCSAQKYQYCEAPYMAVFWNDV